MSNIYIQEPATRGKVVLDTSVGDIEIELFSKECPLACRNFVQLCLDGYYDGTVFHRVVPQFIAQGGDPTGTGEGGESATGGFFADEFHSRLRYTRRGLVGMVNQGPNMNGSQFFFTLGSTAELQNKNTLFGKIVGDTIFNVLKLEEGEIVGETPVHKQKIIKTEVISNPFPNMVARPRANVDTTEDDEQQQRKQTVTAKAIKNYGLLSFGNEAEEDEEEVTKISTNFKQKGGGSKSAHDLAQDATLSKMAVPLNDEESSDEELPNEKDQNVQKEKSDAVLDKEQLDRVRQRFNAKKINVKEKKKTPVVHDMDDDEEIPPTKSNDDVKREIQQLKKELKQSKIATTTSTAIQPTEQEEEEEEEEKAIPIPASTKSTGASTSVLMDELMAGTRRSTKKNHTSHSNSRESQTLDLLAKFRAKLHAAKDEPETEVAVEPVNETADTEQDEFLKHRFVSDDLLDNIKDIYTNAELLSVYDPRNPMTKRRREESSALLHQKKHKARS